MYTRLTVQVTDTAFPKTMVVPITKRITIGRSDLDDPTSHPDVDLVACNAVRNGISRLHASIEVTPDGDLCLIDLASRNGTSINGIDLAPNQPYALEDGDKIRLGKLQMTIFME